MQKVPQKKNWIRESSKSGCLHEFQ